MSAAILGLAAVACGSPEKMAEMAENVTVKCEPAVLEVIGGEIDAEVSVTYPADYFHPKAILEVTPSFTKVERLRWSRSCSRARRFRTTIR